MITIREALHLDRFLAIIFTDFHTKFLLFFGVLHTLVSSRELQIVLSLLGSPRSIVWPVKKLSSLFAKLRPHKALIKTNSNGEIGAPLYGHEWSQMLQSACPNWLIEKFRREKARGAGFLAGK